MYDDILPAIQGVLDDLTKELAKPSSEGKNIIEVLFGMASNSDMTSSAKGVLGPVITALQNSWVMLAPQLKKIWDTLWPILEPMVKDAAMYAGAAFGIGFIKGIGGYLLGLGGTALLKSIPKLFKGGLLKGLLGKVSFWIEYGWLHLKEVFLNLGKFLSKKLPTLSRILFRTLPRALITGLKFAIKAFPILVALDALGSAIYDGYQKWSNGGSALEIFQEMGASFLNAITLGIFGTSIR